jgi:hypothetical protein
MPGLGGSLDGRIAAVSRRHSTRGSSYATREQVVGHHYPAAWKRQGRVFDDAVVGGTNLEDKGPLGGDIAGSRISESRNRNTRQEPERQHCAITHHRGYVGTGYGICMVGKGSCRAALVNFEQASSPMSTNCFSLLKTLLGRFSILRNEPISPQTYIKAHQSRCKSTLRTRLRSIPTQLPHPTLLTVLPSPCSPHPASPRLTSSFAPVSRSFEQVLPSSSHFTSCIPGAGLDMLPRYEDAGASRQRSRARPLFEP